MHPDWTRWIHASISLWFSDCLKNKVTLYIEGQKKQTIDQHYAELRWNGPIAEQNTAREWSLELDVNFIVTSKVNVSNAYDHKKVVGIVQATIVPAITVKKYDDGEGYLGCLQLRHSIKTNYFGQVQGAEVEESTIEATYYLSLET